MAGNPLRKLISLRNLSGRPFTPGKKANTFYKGEGQTPPLAQFPLELPYFLPIVFQYHSQ